MHVVFIISLWFLSSVFAEDSTVLDSEYPWLSLPPTPKLPPPRRGHYVSINGVRIWYQIYGPKHGQPLLFLHGGLANSDYWGQQVRRLRFNYRCIVMDSRGHGRSTMPSANITYELMASDVIQLLDHLRINKTHLIGWSDGGVIGLTIAMNSPDRLKSLFVFGAHYEPSGNKNTSLSTVFKAFLKRTQVEYESINTNRNFTNFFQKLFHLWSTSPLWNQADFARIPTDLPVWIVSGDHEEAIHREQPDTMTKWIPQAGELIIPRTSHFALIQNPEFFTWSIRRFLRENRISY